VALIVNGLPAADDRYEQPSEADVHAATSSKLARAFSSAPSTRIIVRAAALGSGHARGDEEGGVALPSAAARSRWRRGNRTVKVRAYDSY